MKPDVRRPFLPLHLFWPLLAACGVLALVVLALMPAEKTLGQVIKIVYLHGALSRAGMLGLVAAGLPALIWLLLHRPAAVAAARAAAWTNGLLLSGWAFWTAHFIVSMPATRLTWGPWIAWGEPRVTMTLQVIAAGLVVILVTRLVGNRLFTAMAALLLAFAVAFMAGRTGVLRHPLDPIGGSPSATLQFAYFLLLVPVVASMVLVAWRLAAREEAARAGTAAPLNAAAGDVRRAG